MISSPSTSILCVSCRMGPSRIHSLIFILFVSRLFSFFFEVLDIYGSVRFGSVTICLPAFIVNRKLSFLFFPRLSPLLPQAPLSYAKSSIAIIVSLPVLSVTEETKLTHSSTLVLKLFFYSLTLTLSKC